MSQYNFTIIWYADFKSHLNKNLRSERKFWGKWKKFIHFKMIYTHFFYKHMNFLAEAFAKCILCLFFSTKVFMCYVLNFFEKKAFMCLFSQRELHVKTLMCLIMCLFFSTKAFMCYVLNFFEKKAFMCLIGHVLIKKMSVHSFLAPKFHFSTNILSKKKKFL